MTLEELSKAYYAAYWGINTTNNNERDIAGVRAVVLAIDAAGFAIVPKTATDEMLRAYYTCMEGTHPTARMNPDKYLTHNLKAGKRWAAMLKAAKEAVLGGASCQSSEHAMPESTPKGEQQS